MSPFSNLTVTGLLASFIGLGCFTILKQCILPTIRTDWAGC
ncbi:hypothetical protein [Magnetococcus sp. PR-3]